MRHRWTVLPGGRIKKTPKRNHKCHCDWWHRAHTWKKRQQSRILRGKHKQLLRNCETDSVMLPKKLDVY